jgi:small subunit ribosomal protein S8
VPHLLPHSGGRGPGARRDEVELVMAVSTVGVVSDPIADMLTRIRNANSARHAEVRVPSSRLKLEIARVLRDEGYIGGYDVEKNADRAGEVVKITFKARPDRKRVISGVKRISRPGLRVYARKTEIPRVLGGLGIAILSTSQGVMSGIEAQRAGVGGEVLAYVW